MDATKGVLVKRCVVQSDIHGDQVDALFRQVYRIVSILMPRPDLRHLATLKHVRHAAARSGISYDVNGTADRQHGLQRRHVTPRRPVFDVAAQRCQARVHQQRRLPRHLLFLLDQRRQRVSHGARARRDARQGLLNPTIDLFVTSVLADGVADKLMERPFRIEVEDVLQEAEEAVPPHRLAVHGMKAGLAIHGRCCTAQLRMIRLPDRLRKRCCGSTSAFDAKYSAERG